MNFTKEEKGMIIKSIDEFILSDRLSIIEEEYKEKFLYLVKKLHKWSEEE